MQEEDIEALRAAVAALEHPGLAVRLAELAGKPIELFNRALPEVASKAIAVATTQALNTALRVALRTMQNEPKRASSSYLHKALAATSGAVGGSFGLAALPIELPISTVNNGTYVIPFLCRWREGGWQNAKTSRSIEATVIGWRPSKKLR